MKLLKKKAFYQKQRVDTGSIKARRDKEIEEGREREHSIRRNSINPSANRGDESFIDDNITFELPKKFALDYDAKNGFPETP